MESKNKPIQIPKLLRLIHIYSFLSYNKILTVISKLSKDDRKMVKDSEGYLYTNKDIL